MNERTTPILKSASAEQQAIVDRITEGYNVCVPSVAGSGKTTTIMHIANQHSCMKILVLTYNARLRQETKTRVEQFGLDNAEVHNYHSFCVKYYSSYECHTDSGINHMLREQPPPSKPYWYDLLVIDEIQDMNSSYFELVCLIYCMCVKSNRSIGICTDMDTTNKVDDLQLCVLGDAMQSIFQYSGADERFINYPDKIFPKSHRKWCIQRLSTSFRLTVPVANFLNRAVLRRSIGNEHTHTTKTHVIKRQCNSNDGVVMIKAPMPRYIITNTFGSYSSSYRSRAFQEVVRYLEMGYRPEDFFILAQSTKSERCPVRCLENELKTYLPSLQLFVQTDNEGKVDPELIAGKMVFSTFHRTKGLERSVVFAFGVDMSFYSMRANGSADENQMVVPNIIYVMLTRTLEHLVLFHHYQHDYLPFLDREQLELTCTVIIDKPLKLPTNSRNSRSLPTTKVTDLVQHLPSAVSDDCMRLLVDGDLVSRTEPSANVTTIDITPKVVQPNGHSESVREITGTFIPCYYEYIRSGKKTMSVLDQLHQVKYHEQLVSIPLAVKRYGDNLHQAMLNQSSARMIREEEDDGPSVGNKCLLDSDDDEPSPKVTATTASATVTKATATATTVLPTIALHTLSESFLQKQSIRHDKQQYVRAHPELLPQGVQDQEDQEYQVQEDQEDEDLLPICVDGHVPYDLQYIRPATLTVAEGLFVCNCWNAHVSGYLNPVYQIKTYDWINQTALDQCMARMDALNIDSNGQFEKSMELSNRVELLGRTLCGSADCIDGRYTYEFKCVGSLQPQHYLQLVIYMYLDNHTKSQSNHNSNPFAKYRNKSGNHREHENESRRIGRLYNILTDELVEIRNEPKIIDEIVKMLFYAKYSTKNRITDADFIKDARKRCRNYLNRYDIKPPSSCSSSCSGSCTSIQPTIVTRQQRQKNGYNLRGRTVPKKV
jgi:hypothetical protein